MRVYRFLPRDYHLRSTQIHKKLPELLICPCVRGCFMYLRRPFAMEHPLHSSSFASRTIPCCSVVLRSSTSWECPAAQWYSLISTAGFLGSCLGASTAQEYSTSIFSCAAVGPVAVKAVQRPGQRKPNGTLSLELGYNPRGAPFESVAVFDESRQGK